jgi:HNH endonuclease/TraM recognition site of TraD and TraG
MFGGPGSGKTNFLQLLVEAAAGRMPIVVVDPKGSPALAETVRAHGGQVWTLDGKLPADLLDPRPWQVPDLLLEAEDYSAEARVYRDAAHQRALWAAWALALQDKPMDLAQLRRLLDREALLRALEPHRDRDGRIGGWIDRLEHQRGGIEDSGARGLDRALGVLLDGVAMRGSLRACSEALRLEDVLETNGLVLFSLDVADYPHATRKVASWILLGMGRLARQLPECISENTPRALLLVDEVGALGSAARHLRRMVGRAREAGLAVVLATQGPSDLEAVDRALLPQVLQDTAWQLAFRQGSPQDAERMQALFGQAWVNDESWRSDGLTTTRLVERPRVSIDEWMNALEPGDAWLRVAPIDRGWRQERVRVALPTMTRKLSSETTLGKYVGNHVSNGPRVVSESDIGANDAARRDMPRAQPSLPPVPPDCPAELLAKMGADILAKVERRWPKRHHELGPCLVWRDGEPVIQAAGGLYGRIYDPAIKRSDAAHLVVWRRVYGPIPRGLEVDHVCNVTLCQRPDHLQLLTKGDNVKRRGPTRGPNRQGNA